MRNLGRWLVGANRRNREDRSQRGCGGNWRCSWGSCPLRMRKKMKILSVVQKKGREKYALREKAKWVEYRSRWEWWRDHRWGEFSRTLRRWARRTLPIRARKKARKPWSQRASQASCRSSWSECHTRWWHNCGHWQRGSYQIQRGYIPPVIILIVGKDTNRAKKRFPFSLLVKKHEKSKRKITVAVRSSPLQSWRHRKRKSQQGSKRLSFFLKFFFSLSTSTKTKNGATRLFFSPSLGSNFRANWADQEKVAILNISYSHFNSRRRHQHKQFHGLMRLSQLACSLEIAARNRHWDKCSRFYFGFSKGKTWQQHTKPNLVANLLVKRTLGCDASSIIVFPDAAWV